jgi:hypothetical protein
MAFDIRQIDLGKLNSMTKYPSILTYHALGDIAKLRREDYERTLKRRKK